MIIMNTMLIMIMMLVMFIMIKIIIMSYNNYNLLHYTLHMYIHVHISPPSLNPLLMQSSAIIVGGSGALGRAFISHLNALNYVRFKFQCFLFNKLY